MIEVKMKEFTAQERREWAEEQANKEWMIIRRYPEAFRSFSYLYQAAPGEKPYVRRQSFIRKMAQFFVEAQQ